jgi:hypothetical protein
MVDDNVDGQTSDNSSATGNEGDSPSDGTGSQDSLELQLQKERSSRGREVSSLKSELAEMKKSLDMLVSQTSRPTPPKSGGEEPPVKFITTPEELETYNTWKASKDVEKKRQYAVEYVHTAKGLKYLNPELHDEIEKELLYSDTKFDSMSNFSNPSKDAEINYRIAESNVVKRKLAEAIAGKPTKGGNNPATGITATSTNVASPKKKVELDEYAKKFLDAMGEKDDADWVQKSVQREDF